VHDHDIVAVFEQLLDQCTADEKSSSDHQRT
jgi:hypothetical protein